MKTKKSKSIAEKFGLDKSYELVYIDYRDMIEDDELIEKMVRAGNCDALCENDWYWEARIDGARYVVDEKRKEFPEMTDEEAEQVLIYIQEHDESRPEKDLIRNTPAKFFYYSLGLEDNGMELEGGEPLDERVAAICKHMGIFDDDFKKSVREMCDNAGYGGNLVILFESDIEDMLEDGKYIKFDDDARLCLMNRGQGAGHDVKLGRKIVVPFKRENLHTDEGAAGYSYAGDVCGMCRGVSGSATICDNADGAIMVSGGSESAEEIAFAARETNFADKWKKTGKCSAGDMNITRHKRTEYVNNFPCGNKCAECGTFWVD